MNRRLFGQGGVPTYRRSGSKFLPRGTLAGYGTVNQLKVTAIYILSYLKQVTRVSKIQFIL